MNFVFTGFTQEYNLRQFAFQRIEPDRSRTEVTVDADLVLSRKYAIPVQELPLLCRRLLEARPEGDACTGLTFTEDEMRIYSDARRAAQVSAVLRRRTNRRPASPLTGLAWRSPAQ